MLETFVMATNLLLLGATVLVATDLVLFALRRHRRAIVLQRQATCL